MQNLPPGQENSRPQIKCTGKGAKRGEHGNLQRVDVALDNASLRRPFNVPCQASPPPDRCPPQRPQPAARPSLRRAAPKWNAIEHRLFSFIGTNWRGKPLESLEVIINLIAGTATNMGLKVYARVDTGSYPKGVEVPDEQFAAINIHRDAFHGEWNYTIKPSVIEK